MALRKNARKFFNNTKPSKKTINALTVIFFRKNKNFDFIRYIVIVPKIGREVNLNE